jgi:Uma2 family endonuclease
MAKLELPARKLTYEEFLTWCDEDTWAEWVDGEVVVLSPASSETPGPRGLPGRPSSGRMWRRKDLELVLSAPFQMKTGPDLPGREPDLLFVARENLGRLKDRYLEGPADLVVEVVSPESRLRDRGEKFAEYEAGGVREYWLVDPEARQADFYVLGPDNRYDRRRADAAGIYRSQVVEGLWVRPEWLWQDPLPPVLVVLRELGLLG